MIAVIPNQGCLGMAPLGRWDNQLLLIPSPGWDGAAGSFSGSPGGIGPSPSSLGVTASSKD